MRFHFCFQLGLGVIVALHAKTSGVLGISALGWSQVVPRGFGQEKIILSKKRRWKNLNQDAKILTDKAWQNFHTSPNVHLCTRHFGISSRTLLGVHYARTHSIALTFCAVGCCASKLMILIKDHVSSSWRDIYTFGIAFGAFCENFHIGNQLKLSLRVNRPDGIRSIAIKKVFLRAEMKRHAKRIPKKKRRTFQTWRNYRIASIISAQHDFICFLRASSNAGNSNTGWEVRGK